MAIGRYWILGGSAALVLISTGISLFADGVAGLETASWVASIIGVIVAIMTLAVEWRPRRQEAHRPEHHESSASPAAHEDRGNAKYRTFITDSRNIHVGDIGADGDSDD